MLTINQLHLKTNETLLYGANLQIKPGVVYGLSAGNGSGKTTLLRTISGLRDESEGSMSIEDQGRALSGLQIKEALFYFETSEWLDPNLSGLDYLRFTSSAWKQKGMSVKSSIEFWEMERYINVPIKKYSLGMKQKVVLAMYGVSGAKYWLLDEPTIGLDRNSTKKFEAYIFDAKREDKGVLFSSHQDDSLYAVCDFVYKMENQSLVLSDSANWEAGE